MVEHYVVGRYAYSALILIQFQLRLCLYSRGNCLGCLLGRNLGVFGLAEEEVEQGARKEEENSVS